MKTQTPNEERPSLIKLDTRMEREGTWRPHDPEVVCVGGTDLTCILFDFLTVGGNQRHRWSILTRHRKAWGTNPRPSCSEAIVRTTMPLFSQLYGASTASSHLNRNTTLLHHCRSAAAKDVYLSASGGTLQDWVKGLDTEIQGC